jgi:HEAT repeat protein
LSFFLGFREGELAHVFLSYVRENSDIVDRLAKELRDSGVTVWLDRNNIEPGARWKDAIKKAIQNGKFFMACFSREYNERTRTHMGEELTIAIDELRARPSDKTWFIPIMLNNTTIPSRRISSVEDLSDLNVVKLYEDWNKGITSILRVLEYDNPDLARVWHLIDIVEKPFASERLHAIHELGAMGTLAKPAVPVLMEASKSKKNDAKIRLSSLDALEKIGVPAAEAVPALAAALSDPDKNVQWFAQATLADMVVNGPAAAEAVAALAEAVPALAAALNEPNGDGNVRSIAAILLGKVGPAAVEAAPALAAALNEPNDGDVRRSAAYALGKIGPAAGPALVAALNHPDGDVRRSATEGAGP